jgi:hypothetical protein
VLTQLLTRTNARILLLSGLRQTGAAASTAGTDSDVEDFDRQVRSMAQLVTVAVSKDAAFRP